MPTQNSNQPARLDYEQLREEFWSRVPPHKRGRCGHKEAIPPAASGEVAPKTKHQRKPRGKQREPTVE